jgi:RNA polymerase sigma-70 factor, ECF subfamily
MPPETARRDRLQDLELAHEKPPAPGAPPGGQVAFRVLKGHDPAGPLREVAVADLNESTSTSIHGSMRAEDEVVELHPEREVPMEPKSFEELFLEQHDRLYRALYFITGSLDDAEDLMQDAFLRLWERWDEIGRIEDLTGYLFRSALNGFRMRRRRAAMAVRKVVPVLERRDVFLDAEMRADVRQLLLEVTPRQRAALLLVDLFGYPAEQAAHILRVRPSTVRVLASKGRRALRSMEGARDA